MLSRPPTDNIIIVVVVVVITDVDISRTATTTTIIICPSVAIVVDIDIDNILLAVIITNKAGRVFSLLRKDRCFHESATFVQ